MGCTAIPKIQRGINVGIKLPITSGVKRCSCLAVRHFKDCEISFSINEAPSGHTQCPESVTDRHMVTLNQVGRSDGKHFVFALNQKSMPMEQLRMRTIFLIRIDARNAEVAQRTCTLKATRTPTIPITCLVMLTTQLLIEVPRSDIFRPEILIFQGVDYERG